MKICFVETPILTDKLRDKKASENVVQSPTIRWVFWLEMLPSQLATLPKNTLLQPEPMMKEFTKIASWIWTELIYISSTQLGIHPFFSVFHRVFGFVFLGGVGCWKPSWNQLELIGWFCSSKNRWGFSGQGFQGTNDTSLASHIFFRSWFHHGTACFCFFVYSWCLTLAGFLVDYQSTAKLPLKCIS